MFDLVIGLLEWLLPSKDKRTARYERIGWMVGVPIAAIILLTLFFVFQGQN